jgi:predicted dehydrogenase
LNILNRMQKQPFKRILFIGLGGAGQRHLRLFKENLSDNKTEFIAYRKQKKTPPLNPDFSVNQEQSLEDMYGVIVFNSIKEALDTNPDLAVISTPSSMHLEYAQLCAEKGINIFVEKPLSNSLDGLSELKETVNKNKVGLQVGFQRRFHPHFQKTNEIIKSNKLGKITNAIFTVASYIPRWHPYEDYLDLYACRKDLGGGVLLTEIHEFDLCVWYFGKPESVTCVGGTYSDVGMDVEDTVHVTLDYTSFSVQINLTFWQKHHERTVAISGENGYLTWNQDDDQLLAEYFDENIENCEYEYNNPGNDAMFDQQIKSVLENLTYQNSMHSLDDSALSIAIVESAKQSMAEKRTIELNDIDSL